MNTTFYRSTDFSPEGVARNETLFTVANGRLGFRGDFEEKKGTRHKGTYINGFFDSEPIVYGENAYGYAKNHQTILNLPDSKRIDLEVNGYPFSVLSGDGTIEDFEMLLNFNSGVMARNVLWKAPDGTAVEIKTKRMVSFIRENVAVLEYRVKLPDTGARIHLSSSIDTTAHNITAEEDPRVGSKFSSSPLLVRDLSAHNSQLYFYAETRNSDMWVAGSAFHELRVSKKSIAQQCIVRNGLATESWSIDLLSGEELILHKYIWFESAKKAEFSPFLSEEEQRRKCMNNCQELQKIGFDELCNEQQKYLENFWKTAAISIGGDSASELALHFNLFHLLQSSGRDGRTSIAAKGLTAEGYEGHYFWDTEAYVCPVFTYVQPSIAKSLLEYRYSILPKSKERAEVMSLKGALFPWRTIDGEETSAYYPAGTAQYHINADIMFALEKYLHAAGSDSFDTEKIVEMAIETARMWMSLGSFIESRDGAFCINGVTGPDEYTACVNNNAYTNFMARHNLRFSIFYIEKNAPKRISESEIASWKMAVDKMFIPFDSSLGIYAQDDSFLHKSDWDFENTPTSKYPLLLNFHPLVIYRHKVLKQPDLVLAQFLLSGEFSLAEKKRNFQFYEPLTTGDSSLSHCIQSIMACEIGEYEKAEKYFEKTARMDIEDVHGNTCDGIHTAAMAGSWMSIVYGFAGFRDWKGNWSFNPYLPSKWNEVSFSLCLNDCVLHVSLERKKEDVIVSYTLREGKKLCITHRNIPVSLEHGQAQSFSLKRKFKAVIFDLDGVITDTAELHYLAWKRISDDAGLKFDREVNESLRGVSREESFNIILSHNNKGMEKKDCEKLIHSKNKYYVSLLSGLSSKDILPGITSLLAELKKQGIKVVLASASKNAALVCEKLGLLTSFDAIADVSLVQMSKPEPDVFLSGADLVGVWPSDCIGIEDAQAGIESIQKAGMLSVAIGLGLKGADKTIADTSYLTFELLESCFEK